MASRPKPKAGARKGSKAQGTKPAAQPGKRTPEKVNWVAILTVLGIFLGLPIALYQAWSFVRSKRAFLTVVGFARANGLNVLRLTDLLAPSCFLGDAFGRWGCFFAGDDYGRPIADTPWFPEWLGVRFTHVKSLVPLDLRGVPLHPTQIYMSLKALTIALILYAVTRRKKFDGQVVGLALVLYALFRSGIELLRGDADRGQIGMLSTAQFTSVFVFAAGLLVLLMAPRRTLADELGTDEPAPAAAGGGGKKRRRR